MRPDRIWAVCFGMVFCFGMAGCMGLCSACSNLLKESAARKFDKEHYDGPICGLLSIEGAFQAIGHKPPDRAELFAPKYLGTESGSTASELCRAVRDFGLNAEARSNMTLSQLRFGDYPMVLHVRNSNGVAFNHWVLFLGYRDSKPIIADLPGEPVPISESELMAIWDGSAIIVSPSPINPFYFGLRWIFFDVIPWLAITTLLLWISSFISNLIVAKNVLKPGIARGAMTISVIVLLVLIRHGAQESGFFWNSNSFRLVTQASLPVEIVDLKSAARLIREDSVVVVDARFPSQFSHGHLRNAINIPHYTTRTELQKMVSGIEPKSKFVVYCAGPKCPFAGAVARMLKAKGFDNVFVFEGEGIELAQATN